MRQKLLRTGMGFFLCFGLITAVNVIVLPFARACHGYALSPMLLTLAAFLALAAGIFVRLERVEEARLRRGLRWAEPAFLAVLLIVQIGLAYWMEYTPAGDNFMLYNGSMMLAQDGCFDANPDFGLYLARFSNQWGFVLILTAIRKMLVLVGIEDFFMPLAVIQALLYTAGTRAAACTADMLGGTRARARTLVLMACCLPLYLAAGVLYTDTFSAPFVVLTLYFALRTVRAQKGAQQLGLAALTGLLALIGGQIKMTVFIVLIAAVIVFALSLRPGRAALCALLSAGIALGGTAAVHEYMLGEVIDPDVYAQQNTPAIHWVMMSIPTSDNPYGGFSGDYSITWGMMDEGASHEEVMSSIYTRMRDRIYTLRYPNRLLLAMLRKNAAAMGDGTFGMTEMLDDDPVRPNAVSTVVLAAGEHFPLYSAICTGFFMGDLVLALLACLRAIRRRETGGAMAYIAMFGMMLFLMLWEARSRYLFCFVPVLLVLAGLCPPSRRGAAGGQTDPRRCEEKDFGV